MLKLTTLFITYWWSWNHYFRSWCFIENKYTSLYLLNIISFETYSRTVVAYLFIFLHKISLIIFLVKYFLHIKNFHFTNLSNRTTLILTLILAKLQSPSYWTSTSKNFISTCFVLYKVISLRIQECFEKMFCIQP